MKSKALMLAITILSSSAWASDSSANKGAILFETCKACHGAHAEGNPAIKAPAIAGLPEWYLISTLKKFRDGIRGAHPDDVTGLQMRPMARQLVSDENVEAVAKEISALPVQTPKATLHGDLVAGQTAFTTCMACHGAKAEGNEALKAPPIGRLPDWYVVDQLVKFKAGIRGVHPKDVQGAQMRPMAQMLVDRQAMENVAAYIFSLQHSTTTSTPDHGAQH